MQQNYNQKDKTTRKMTNTIQESVYLCWGKTGCGLRKGHPVGFHIRDNVLFLRLSDNKYVLVIIFHILSVYDNSIQNKRRKKTRVEGGNPQCPLTLAYLSTCPTTRLADLRRKFKSSRQQDQLSLEVTKRTPPGTYLSLLGGTSFTSCLFTGQDVCH